MGKPVVCEGAGLPPSCNDALQIHERGSAWVVRQLGLPGAFRTAGPGRPRFAPPHSASPRERPPAERSVEKTSYQVFRFDESDAWGG